MLDDGTDRFAGYNAYHGLGERVGNVDYAEATQYAEAFGPEAAAEKYPERIYRYEPEE